MSEYVLEDPEVDYPLDYDELINLFNQSLEEEENEIQLQQYPTN